MNLCHYLLYRVLGCIFLAFIFQSACAQSLVSRWQYAWGGNREEVINKMIPIGGNRYFYAGSSASDSGTCTRNSINYGLNDFVAFVMDDSGNKLWEKSYGGLGEDKLSSAARVASGGYVLAGSTESPPSGVKASPLHGSADFWVVRIDDNGNLLWENTYGSDQYDGAAKVIPTKDGGFLVGGISISNQPGVNNGYEDYELIKIDANGNLLWTKLFGGSGNDELLDMIEASDGKLFFKRHL